jgi:hypothetical protein
MGSLFAPGGELYRTVPDSIPDGNPTSVFRALLRCFGEGCIGRAIPAIELMTAMGQCSRSTVYRGLKVLESLGWIRIGRWSWVTGRVITIVKRIAGTKVKTTHKRAEAPPVKPAEAPPAEAPPVEAASVEEHVSFFARLLPGRKPVAVDKAPAPDQMPPKDDGPIRAPQTIREELAEFFKLRE